MCTDLSLECAALQDKVGPFCRAASDCALILDAIRGRDVDDVASLDVALDSPFTVNVTSLTLGVLPSIQDRASEVRQRLLPCQHRVDSSGIRLLCSF